MLWATLDNLFTNCKVGGTLHKNVAEWFTSRYPCTHIYFIPILDADPGCHSGAPLFVNSCKYEYIHLYTVHVFIFLSFLSVPFPDFHLFMYNFISDNGEAGFVGNPQTLLRGLSSIQSTSIKKRRLGLWATSKPSGGGLPTTLSTMESNCNS